MRRELYPSSLVPVKKIIWDLQWLDDLAQGGFVSKEELPNLAFTAHKRLLRHWKSM
jgi:hypothetical protein